MGKISTECEANLRADILVMTLSASRFSKRGARKKLRYRTRRERQVPGKIKFMSEKEREAVRIMFGCYL